MFFSNNKHVDKVETVGSVKILRLKGAFAKETTPHIKKVCEEMIKDKNIHSVLVDFKEVTGIDTAAFACLIEMMNEHVKSGLMIGLVNLNEIEEGLLEVLKIRTMLHIYNDEQTAMKELSANHGSGNQK